MDYIDKNREKGHRYQPVANVVASNGWRYKICEAQEAVANDHENEIVKKFVSIVCWGWKGTHQTYDAQMDQSCEN